MPNRNHPFSFKNWSFKKLSFKNITFKRKLMVFSLLISIIPVLIVGFFSAFIATQNIQEEVNLNHSSTLKQIHFQINNLLKNLQIISIRLASNPALERSVQAGYFVDNLSQTFDMIESIKREYSYSTIKFNVSLVYTAQKYVYYSSNMASSLTESQAMDMVRDNKPIENASFMVLPDPADKQPDLLLFRPVPMYTHYTDGILVLHVNVDELVKFLDTLNAGVGSKILIVDRTGSVIFSKDKKDIGTQLQNVSTLDKTKDTQLQLPDNYMLDGKDYQVSFQNSSFNNWTYIVMTPTMELMHRADYIKKMTVIMVAVIVLLWVLLAFVGSNRLYFPIAVLLKKIVPEQERHSEPWNDLKALGVYIDRMVASKHGLEQEIKEQSPYLRQSIFQQLLLGEMSDREMQSKTERYNLPLKGDWFYVCIADVDQHAEFARKYNKGDRTLIHNVIRKMIEEIVGEERQCLTFVPHMGQVIIIISMDAANWETDKWVQGRMDLFRHYLEEHVHLTASVAVGPAQFGYSGINQSYEQALKFLRYRLTMGHNVTISNDNVEPSVKQLNQSIMEKQKHIVFSVIHGNIDEANLQLADMIVDLPDSVESTEAVLASLTYLLGELEYMLHQMGCRLNETLNVDVYKQLYRMKTIGEVEEWLSRQVFPGVKEQLEKMTVSKKTKIIQQVLQYVNEHYKSDLSLQSLADEFNISPSHLSRMFKEETNRTFSDYILEYRMNKAKEWLEHTDMPIKEIADQLRYTNVTNFTRAFKHFYGTPPGQFRLGSMSEM
ncbi:helix-turn-helix domain-containing protein [Paenibacillus koleovorans]|uniref:helix-turn-helix domain-containing protein n=1 Tax=Paenibacillus koleovorans TaxID=121608 RepID=UPI000FDC0963|nr:helix-turn-helix domain-containing protein [Paenibacillus koleovorans]